jgi:hypothetical protein
MEGLIVSSKTRKLSKNRSKREKKTARLSESESSSSWENKHEMLIKTSNPENRLKLTIRVKRSPEYINEPEYEILRTEGLSFSPEQSKKISQKRSRRHRHKKNKCKRINMEISDSGGDDKYEFKEKSNPITIPTTKRVKLLFGENKMKILNIPNSAASSLESEIKSNSNILPSKNLLAYENDFSNL